MEDDRSSAASGGEMQASPSPAILEDELETNRVEALSDGVIAIAITLLIIEIGVPHLEEGEEGLFSAMWDRWPLYLAYVASFWSIGLAWIIHHQMFRCIRRFDHLLLLFNLIFLLVIAFVPHPTAIVGEYLLAEEEQDAALAVYSGTWLLLALSLNLLWWWARRADLLHGGAELSGVQSISRQILIGIPLYAGVLLLSFVSFPLTLILYVVIAIVYTVTRPVVRVRPV